MKQVLIFLLISFSAYGKFLPDGCPGDQIRQQGPAGYYCAPLYALFPQAPADCIVCQQQANLQRQMQTQPWLFAPQQQVPWGYNPYSPWWAQQGQMMYPNFNYPGAWQYPGIAAHHYPGSGGMFAAKPNVYVKNGDGKLTNFQMSFDVSRGASFLATTPWLNENSWEGLVTTDAFRVDNVKYDYLFYDVRLDHRLMQFRAGWCVASEHLVEGMIGELRALGFSSLAMQDFKEHWQEKIPHEEQAWCVYPQFNQQLDQALPVSVTPKAPFTRVVFILVPQRREERRPASVFPELPRLSHVALRPSPNPVAKLHYLEWGVAFLDHRLIQ